MNPNWRRLRRLGGFAVGLASALALTGCGGASNSATAPPAVVSTDEGTPPPAAQPGIPQPDQSLFATPELAAGTLKDAVLARDRRALVSIFGEDGKQLIFSGDPVQETNDLERFAAHLREYAYVDHVADDKAILYVGAQNWPFPIPIVKSDNGWFFDTAAGKDEILNRRIGEDELSAIAVCRAYVQAQLEYASRPRMPDGVIQYAQHIMSRPGTHDGLYWEVGPGEDLSPLGPLVAEAREENYPATQPTTGGPHPYKGYIFHCLTAQGPAAPGGALNYIVDGKMTKGFALIASPSAYGASGIMTFIVGKDGVVYQKDLGENTHELVKAITDYNPDSTWAVVKDQ